MISDSELISYNQRGLIVGPSEDENQFLTRVRAVKPQNSPDEIAEVNQIITELFDISIDWVPIIYSNKQLRFWEGAATWNTNEGALIQLHPGFKSGKYLHIYQRVEVLAHEFAHTARAAFEEGRFEEHFAYYTSSSAFRRYFGPLFRRPWESLFFIATLGMSLILELWFPMDIPFSMLLPFALFILALWRLEYSHRTFRKALRKLKTLRLRNPEALLFRLTDPEIKFFSSHTPSEILRYIKEQACLRWRQIKACYPSALSSLKVRVGRRQSPGIELSERGVVLTPIQPPSPTAQSRELSR